MCHGATLATQAGKVKLNVLMLLLAALLMEMSQDVPSGPSAWCCTLDADIPLLLTIEEEEQYLERSLKAAANSCPDLVPCPQPDCKGMAVAGAGETRISGTCCELHPACDVCHPQAASKGPLGSSDGPSLWTSCETVTCTADAEVHRASTEQADKVGGMRPLQRTKTQRWSAMHAGTIGAESAVWSGTATRAAKSTSRRLDRRKPRKAW